MLTRCTLLMWAALAVSAAPLAAASAPPLPLVQDVELQPLAAQIRRLVEAKELLGSPFGAKEIEALNKAMKDPDAEKGCESIQQILDPQCLIAVNINPEARVKVAAGPAKPELVERGWRQFLVKIQNEAGVTAELRAISPNALSMYEGGWGSTPSDKAFRKRGAKSPDPADLWLDVEMFHGQPLKRSLSGLKLEYALLQLYSRDAGQREAKLAFDAGQGTQDLGFRNEIDILFTAAPAGEITFQVLDEHGQPSMGMFVIRDPQGHVYPSQSKRLAPDFGFHPQIYRENGEKLRLPPGTYRIDHGRGPEYIPKTKAVQVTRDTRTLAFELERWIDPSTMGWWSGDHHIHAAGCAHYTKPTEGVHAPDMMRHCLGEDLKIGANLTWGPCFDYQKQFFTGAIDKVSRYPYLLRYDVEVSGFGSHQSGHLCLLRLREQIYPGGDSKDHWPTLGLNTLRWAKKQGAVCGPAHSGWGLEVGTAELPNYIVPPFNGIGANEYVVDVTHRVPGPDGRLVPAVDFISTVDTPHVWELNMWYHTLNAGFRTRISGETDFPCIYGERVGLGRSYVKLDGKLDYDVWCEGIRQGRNYVGDGYSHLMDFQAGATAAPGEPAPPPVVRMGENGSELHLSKPGLIKVTARVAARLPEEPNGEISRRRYAEKPYWHIERARVEQSRQVPVELVVNGYPVGRRLIQADGRLQEIAFDATIERSSWAALRILPSSHTNPIFVLVDKKPIRASRRSVEWCLKGVDQCWSQKQQFINPKELEQAKADYDHARVFYRQLLAQCDAD